MSMMKTMVVVVAMMLVCLAPTPAAATWRPQLKFGQEHTCMLFSNGTSRCFGYGYNGPLGVDSREDRSASTAIETPWPFRGRVPIRDIIAGLSKTCAVLYDGRMFCIGLSPYAPRNPGLDEEKPLAWGTEAGDTAATQAATFNDGSFHVEHGLGSMSGMGACAVSPPQEGGLIACAGIGANGVTLQESTTNFVGWSVANKPGDVIARSPAVAPADPRVKRLFGSPITFCAIMYDDDVKCWGNQISTDLAGVILGESPGDLAGIQSPVFKQLGNIGYLPKYAELANGKTHMSAVNTAGQAISYGYSDLGQLGNTDELGKHYGLVPSDSMTDAPTLVFSDTELARSTCAGWQHTCMIFNNKRIRCWGDNSRGQLGYPSVLNYTGVITDLAVLPYVSLPGGALALEVSCGFFHTCAMLDPATAPHNGGWICWGLGLNFRSGYEDAVVRNDPSVLEPIPYTNVTGLLRSWNVFPLLFFASNTDAHLSIDGPLFELDPVLKVRLTDTTTAAVIDVPVTRTGPHTVRSTAAVPSHAADMLAPLREVTEMTLTLLTAGDAPLPTQVGLGSLLIATVNGLVPTLIEPTGITPGKSFSVKLQIPGYAARDLGSRSHGTCNVGAASFLLAYDGDADFVLCTGLLSPSALPGLTGMSITLGYGFDPIPIASSIVVFNPVIEEIEPLIGHYAASINITVSGDGFVDLAEGVLCRFSDPASASPLGATHIVPAQFIEVNDTRCTRPPYPELINAPSYPYNLQVEVSFNGGAQWSDPVTIGVHGPHTVTLALPGALPIQGGVALTLHGSGFVPSAAAKARFVIPGQTDVIVAAQFIVASQLYEAVTTVFPIGSETVSVYLAIDGQTYTSAPAPTTVFELTSLSPTTGPVGGGTPISVSGRGFTPVSGSLFCGLSGGVVSVPGAFGSTTRVVCVTPPSPSGSAATFPFGVTLNAVDYVGGPLDTFSYYNPTFTTVDPPIIPADTAVNSAGNFTVYGTGIIGNAPECVLSGVARPAVYIDPAGTFVVCNAYPGLIFEQIFVKLNGIDTQGTGINIAYFELYQALPAWGPASGGTTVTVLGARFPVTPVPQCRFGALPAVAAVLETTSRLRCDAPANAPGTLPLQVSFDGGRLFSESSLTFSYYADPAVTSVVPVSGQQGVDVTLRGNSFTDSATTGLPMRCRFGSTSVLATTLTLIAGTHFVCKAPALAGAVTVEASFNDGASFTADALTFLYMSVLSVGPNLGPFVGGTSVLVSGTGFLQTVNTKCRFTVNPGAVVHLAPATVAGLGQIRCTVPATILAADPVASLEVANDGITFTADGLTMNLYAVPTISAVSPTHIPGTGGTVVTLHGSAITSTGLITARFGAFFAQSCVFTSAAEVRCVASPNAGRQAVQISLNNGFDLHAANAGVSVTFVSLAGLEPAMGPVAGFTNVLFSGSGFLPGSLVCRFTIIASGAQLTTAGVYKTGSQGVCPSPVVPALSPGAATVDLSVDGGIEFTSTGLPYLYYAVPSVSAVSPTSGPEQGGFIVTVYGANLNRTNSDDGPAFCRFGKATAPVLTEVDLGGAVGNAFTCRAPSNVGTQVIEVSLNNGYHYSTGSTGSLAYYTVFLSDPAAGPVTGATDVLIFGSNFKPSGSAVCRFGGLVVAATYVSAAQVRCLSPPQVAGSVVIDYAHDSAQLFTATTVGFTYFVGPTLETIAPSHAPLGSGAVVTVLGTGFFSTPAFVCRFGETVSVNATVVDATLATCPMPDGDGVVEVTMSFNGGAQFSSFGVMFSYITLNNIFPVIGPAAGGANVFFIGSGFRDTEGAKCIFGGVSVPARVASPTSLECSAPPAAVGVVPVTYTGDYGLLVTTPPLLFEYYPTPQVTALQPTEGPSSGGYLVTVHGLNFNNTASSSYCRVGLQNVAPSPPTMQVLPTSTAYLCIVPPGSGLSSIEISLNDGVTFTEDALQFVFFSVFAMVPTLGPATGATPVIVSGTGFKDVALAQCVFGTVAVAAEFISEAEVRCVTPPLTSGAVPVEYTVDGVRFTGDNKLFSYFTDPVITAVTPPGGPSIGGNEVTLHGFNFANVGVAIKCRFGLLTSSAALGTAPGTIVCKAPPGSSDAAVAVSLNNGFQFAESKLTYAYVSLSKLSPSHGLERGGTSLIVSGTGFFAKIFVDDLERAKAAAAAGGGASPPR